MSFISLMGAILRTVCGVFLATVFCLLLVIFGSTKVIQFFVPNWPCDFKDKISIPVIGKATFNDDNDFITFSMKHPEIGGIFHVNYRGEVLDWLRKNQKDIQFDQPALSHDGKKIVYVKQTNNYGWHIHVMDFHGGNDIQLTDTSQYDRNPCFGTDNETIYFVRSKLTDQYAPFGSPAGGAGFRVNKLYTINIHTKRETSLSGAEFVQLGGLNVMPDGKRLIVALGGHSRSQNGKLDGPREVSRDIHNLWMVDLDNQLQADPITPDLHSMFHQNQTYFGSMYNPVLSRDGQYLLLTCGLCQPSTDNGIIYGYDMLTKKARKIISIGATTLIPLAISTKTGKILFTHDLNKNFKGFMYASNLWMCNIDGSGLQNFVLDVRSILGRTP